jgi:hypothetical protein
MLPSSFHAFRAALTVTAGIGVLGIAPPARACSYVETAIESSYPASGAANVPTNVVLYAAGEQVLPGSLYLETADGERVPTSVSRVVPTGFDITPAIELTPNRRYRLAHANIDQIGLVVSSIEFETGSGPVAATDLPPPALAGAILYSVVDSACSGTVLCVESSRSGMMLFAADSDVNLWELVPGNLVARYGQANVPAGCLQVWRRDALGNRSDLVPLCGDDVPRFERPPDTSPMTCEALRQKNLATIAAASAAESADPDAIAADASASAAEPADPDAIASAAEPADDAAGCRLPARGARTSSGACLGGVLALLAALGVRRRAV